MSKYEVKIDEKTCIGCRACTVACHNFVPEGDKAKVVHHIIEQHDLKLNKEGQEVCPVNCIHITKIEEREE